MDFSFSSVAKNVVLPLGINATAGSFAGTLLFGGKYRNITTVSGAISGLLQSVATNSRAEIFKKLDGKLSGIANTVAVALVYLAIYAVHIPVLAGTARFVFGTNLSWSKAIVLTTVGGGLAMLEYLSVQSLIDNGSKAF